MIDFKVSIEITKADQEQDARDSSELGGFSNAMLKAQFQNCPALCYRPT